ncbi:MAG: hypothetical protein LUE98_03540 [Tannerellaceae bacterium]|nr:hypothetical protein [Tannerellaceae bacterium]
MGIVIKQKQRKNIDLPMESIRKLSILAAEAGTSLKAYIENLLIQQANSVEISISQNPSPTNDPWFDDPKNMEIVKKGTESAEKGNLTEMSSDDLKKKFDL